MIDDAAVTPKYVHGFDAKRELPIILKIARGSIFNKVVILLPIALLLSAFAPGPVAPSLMLGGAYLCFEGPRRSITPSRRMTMPMTPMPTAVIRAHLEETKVAGAIKTDFILSAEIMTIALNEVSRLVAEQDRTASTKFALEAASLFVVAVLITAAVYGAVAPIVKADDVGMAMAERRTGPIAALGLFGASSMTSARLVPSSTTTAQLVFTQIRNWWHLW